MAMHAPLVVLGGGPGGYAAAFFAADKGLDVTLVECRIAAGRHMSPARLYSFQSTAPRRPRHGRGGRAGPRLGRPFRQPTRGSRATARPQREDHCHTSRRVSSNWRNDERSACIHARGTLENATTLRLEGSDRSDRRRPDVDLRSPDHRHRQRAGGTRGHGHRFATRDRFDRRSGTRRNTGPTSSSSGAATLAWKWARSTPSWDHESAWSN